MNGNKPLINITGCYFIVLVNTLHIKCNDFKCESYWLSYNRMKYKTDNVLLSKNNVERKSKQNFYHI